MEPIILEGKYGKAEVYAKVCDSTTMSQIVGLLNSVVAKDSVVKIMPDCHAGKGCVIGTTMTIKDKVIPNIVGVDIGCGVLTAQFSKSELDLAEVDRVIREYIPAGFSIRETKYRGYDVEKLLGELRAPISPSEYDRATKSIGTLGGGNHFIEIGESDDEYFLIVHSGSRNLGTVVANYYQELAYKEMTENRAAARTNCISELRSQGMEDQIESALAELDVLYPSVEKDMSYLEGKSFSDYLNDLQTVQKYAEANRNAICDTILQKLGIQEYAKFDTVHNYVDLRYWNYNGAYMLRKGAISALRGQRVNIPLNMRDGCVLVYGHGYEKYNMSAPHGAGRLYGRGAAKATFNLEQFQQEMQGVYSTSVVASTLDESPMAYKTKEDLIESMEDFFQEAVYVKPIYNFKSS